MKRAGILLLLMLFMFTNVISIGATNVNSATTDLPEITIDKDRNNQVDNAKSEFNHGINDEGKIYVKSGTASSFGSSMINSTINSYFRGKDAKDWMRRTEIQFYFQDNMKPICY